MNSMVSVVSVLFTIVGSLYVITSLPVAPPLPLPLAAPPPLAAIQPQPLNLSQRYPKLYNQTLHSHVTPYMPRPLKVTRR